MNRIGVLILETPELPRTIYHVRTQKTSICDLESGS